MAAKSRMCRFAGSGGQNSGRPVLFYMNNAPSSVRIVLVSIGTLEPCVYQLQLHRSKGKTPINDGRFSMHNALIACSSQNFCNNIALIPPGYSEKPALPSQSENVCVKPHLGRPLRAQARRASVTAQYDAHLRGRRNHVEPHKVRQIKPPTGNDKDPLEIGVRED